MNVYEIEVQLKHIQREQERAAQSALRAHQVRLAPRDSEGEKHVRLAEYLGLLLPRRVRARLVR